MTGTLTQEIKIDIAYEPRPLGRIVSPQQIAQEAGQENSVVVSCDQAIASAIAELRESYGVEAQPLPRFPSTQVVYLPGTVRPIMVRRDADTPEIVYPASIQSPLGDEVVAALKAALKKRGFTARQSRGVAGLRG